MCTKVELKSDAQSGALLNLEWYNVEKHIVVGDFVKVVGGVHSGQMGFVNCVDHSDISIIETLGKEVWYFSLEILLSID